MLVLGHDLPKASRVYGHTLIVRCVVSQDVIFAEHRMTVLSGAGVSGVVPTVVPRSSADVPFKKKVCVCISGYRDTLAKNAK